MKTVEQASMDYAKLCDPLNQTLEKQADIRQGFKAGVEFAQRWIHVEKELPQTGELVQIKFVELHGEKRVRFDHDEVIEEDGNKFFSIEQCMVRVICWRPIDIK